jgi:hypothetical protein
MSSLPFCANTTLGGVVVAIQILRLGGVPLFEK